MPLCPFCKNQIIVLKLFSYELTSADFSIALDGMPVIYNQDSLLTTLKGSESFDCPNCSKELFKSRKLAEVFLNLSDDIKYSNIKELKQLIKNKMVVDNL